MTTREQQKAKYWPTEKVYAALTEEPKHEPEPEQDFSPIRVQTFESLSDVVEHVAGLS